MNLLKPFIFYLIAITTCHAQNSLTFEHLTSEQGLSQNDVNAICQDDQGFMWFATHDGLNRYDGYKFTIFNPDPNNSNSMNSNLIWDIVNDNGNLWIGTTGSGLNYYDKETEKFKQFVHEEDNINSLSHNVINALYKDNNNQLWVGGSKNGIDILNLNTKLDSIKFNHYKISPKFKGGNTVQAFYEDRNKQMWVGTSRGLYKVSKDQNNDIYFKFSNPLLGLGYLSARSITEDTFGHLIVGTTAGVFIQTENSNKLTKICGGNVNEVVSHNENIWVGTNNGFIHLKNASRNKLPNLVNHYKYNPKNKNSSLSKNGVNSVFVDKTGIVWIGTNGGGVNKFDPNKKQFKHFQKTSDPNSLSSDKVRSIFEDSNGTLWFGTDGGGLNMMLKKDNDGLYNTFNKFESILKPFVIKEIDYNNSKHLFIGGQFSPGLCILDITNPDKITKDSFDPVKEIPGSVFSIMQDKFKNIWIGTYNGGVRRWLKEKNSNEFKKDILSHTSNQPESIANNIIRDIIEDSKGNIWFGTGGGLSKISSDETHKKNPKFENYKNIRDDITSLSHNYILNLYESSTGDIWIGTFGGGLNKVIPATAENNSCSFKRYSKKDGLPNDVIKAILEDDSGNLWVSTNKGLSKFNPTTEVFKNYDGNDGLQNYEFGELASLKRKNGEFIFGGVNGFNTFFPNEIKDNTIHPETVFTGFSIFNKPVGIGEYLDGKIILNKSLNDIENVKLNYSQNSFSIEFASLHYAASKKNKYAYKLIGFNENWIFTTSANRFATYTNLEPGIYKLMVKASNNDGVWDETPAELNIEVIPPIWRTTTAKFIYFLFFIGCLWAFRRFTIISTSKKYTLELEHFEKEKYEEINRLKLEFFTNISHEFRTPLTLIKGPLEYLMKLGNNVKPKEVQEQCGLMHKNTDYLLRLVNQLMDFRKMDRGKMTLTISEGNIVEFVNEVAEPYQFLSHKKMIDFKVSYSKKSINSWFDSDALEKITNNLLSNAFKFTPENGSVSLSLFDGSDFKPKHDINDKIDKSDYIVLQVKDTGPGIPEHRIKHIFERYYTEIDKKGINPKGTGIGLSFVKTLVEMHQGSINVLSDSENGSTFTVWLPKTKKAYENSPDVSFHQTSDTTNTSISKTDAELHALSVIEDIVDQNISRSRSKLPVLLIIDDNADIRSLIKKGLGELYYIYEAENGKKGLEIAMRVIPNIIITDLMMPIMNGVELCNKLKTTQETSHIPVIMLTAKMSQEWEIEGLKTGADAYIRKPFDMELLDLKLKNILKYRDEMRKRFNREITLEPNEIKVTSSDDKFLQRAIEIVEEHMMDTEFSVELLVKEMNSSRTNLYLKIKELTGLSCSEFIRSIRLKRAIQLLEKSDLSVKEIMYMTGFNTASYFSKCFKKQFGVIPSKYIREIEKEKEIQD